MGVLRERGGNPNDVPSVSCKRSGDTGDPRRWKMEDDQTANLGGVRRTGEGIPLEALGYDQVEKRLRVTSPVFRMPCVFCVSLQSADRTESEGNR